MTSGRDLLSAAVAVAVVAVAGAAPPAPQPPAQTTFRSITDLVSVPVSVRSGERPLTGLTAADFILTDNGVEQRLERVDGDELPIDLTLVLDTSGSTDLVIDGLKRDVRSIAALLRPSDRVRLLTIDTYATEVFPMQPASGPLPLDRLTVSGLSSVHDALAAALLWAAPIDRRHLIVVMTDGIDSMSTLAARAVADVALRSDAVLNILRVDTESGLVTSWEFRCLLMGRCQRESRFWLPYQDREYAMLRQAAEVTGGVFRDQGVLTNRNAVGLFTAVFEEYRHSYVLRYTPRGVPREGFHTIEVRLRGARSPTPVIRARRQYAIGPRLPVDPRSTPRRLEGVSGALAALVQAYGPGDFDAVAKHLAAAPDLAALVREVRASENPWPEAPRREAVFVLELADAALFGGQPRARAAAIELLTWYQPFVRHPLEPDGFEGLWYWAQIALLEGLIDPAAASAAIDNALGRFPLEPRFHLARAVVRDQRWPLGTHESPADGMGRAMPAKADLTDTLAAYEAAARAPGTEVEARVRQAYLLHRMGRHAEAWTTLESVRGRLPDNELRYLHRLVAGRVADARGDGAAATAAYREALSAWPGAQSPRVALMALALRSGDRAGAEELAEAIQTQPADSFDPFWQYWQGDARFYPAIRNLLRQAMR